MSTETHTPAGLDGLDPETRLLVLAKTAAALADPVRLAICELLHTHTEMTVGALTVELPVSQPRVSIHLRCLTDCGYTTVRHQGRRAYYRLTGPEITELLDRLQAHAAGSLHGLLACLHCTPTSEPGTSEHSRC